MVVMGGGSPRVLFWAHGVEGNGSDLADSALNAKARVLRGRRWASLATGPGLWVLWGLYLL